MVQFTRTHVIIRGEINAGACTIQQTTLVFSILRCSAAKATILDSIVRPEGRDAMLTQDPAFCWLLAACCLLLTHVWTREKDKASRGSVPAAQTCCGGTPEPPAPSLPPRLRPRPRCRTSSRPGLSSHVSVSVPGTGTFPERGTTLMKVFYTKLFPERSRSRSETRNMERATFHVPGFYGPGWPREEASGRRRRPSRR